MRIATIHDACFHEENGSYYCNIIDYRLLSDLLKYFDSAVIVVRKGEMKSEYVKVDFENIKVYFVEAITKPKSLILNSIKIFSEIKDAVLMSDAVYCRGINGIIAQKFAERNGIPHFAYLGGCIYDSMKTFGSFNKKVIAKFALKVTQKSIANTSNVIYCSNYLTKRYPTSGKMYIWSGVKVNHITKEIVTKRDNKIARKKNSIRIGLIGYVSNKIKGIDTAIKALSKLDSKYHLKILGGGDHSTYDLLVKELKLEGRVTFCGVLVGGKEVFSWLDDIDIYIQPSLTEGLPKATLEAMSRGCPVISSNVGGLPDITNNKYLHEPGDDKKLSELLIELSTNEYEMRTLSRHSFIVAERYYPNVMEEAFTEVMEDIANQVRKLNLDKVSQ